MSWVEPLVIGLLGVGFIFESLLLIGTFGLVKEHERKMGVILSNYKADLEMVLLAKHSLDEFINHMEGAYKEAEDAKKVNPEETYYIR
jgi:hypothetical protein